MHTAAIPQPPHPVFKPALLGLVCLASVLSQGAEAGATIPFGPDKSISLGLGLRASITHTEDGAPSGKDDLDINLDSMRLYLGGSLNKYVKATSTRKRMPKATSSF